MSDAELMINPSDELIMTVEEFHNLSVYNIGCLLINHRLVVEPIGKTHLIMYVNESNVYDVIEEYKLDEFLGKSFYEVGALEMHYLEVEVDNWFGKILREKYSHKFLTFV